MKKNRNGSFSYSGKLSKVLLRMKLTFVLLLCVMSQVFALASAQTVSLKKQNASLEEILWELKEKTQLVFMYSDEDIASVKGIDIDMKNTQVDAILNKCLEGTDLKYVRENNAIVIRRSRQSENVPQVRMRKISGKVTDTNGDPLPGVTILVDGTTIGVATDNEGKYSLECPEAPDLALNFTFMGMKSQKVTVGPKNVIDVTLEEEMNRLEEAVAVGYGTTKVKDMTGAVTRLGSKDMETAPMGATIQSMLQGKAPGVNVMISSASPTSPVSVIIRGSSSLSGDSQPLWVIDGVPEYNASTSGDVSNTLYNLNLTDVESIDILKDASATAIYGSRAANGVIIVTTKKGRANQEATFSVNVSQTWSVLPKLPTMMTGREERWWRLKALRNMPQAYLDWENRQYKYPTSLTEMERNRLSALDWFYPKKDSQVSDGIVLQDSLNAFYNHATNFFPMYFETGKVTNANIQTYGGSERMNYGIGLGYYDESGGKDCPSGPQMSGRALLYDNC